MLKITESNYEEFKRIFSVLWNFQAVMTNIDPNVSYSPINVLESFEKESKSIGRRSLKMGLNDSLLMMLDLPVELRNKLNDQLISSGFLSLNKLIALVRKIPIKVLKRMKIKNQEEYYVLKEIEQDVDYDISEEDRNKISELIHKFEQQKD